MTLARAAAVALTLALAAPAGAQSPEAPAEEGMGLIEQGMQLILRNFFEQARPELEGMADNLGALANRFGPALGEVSSLVDDIGNYQAPERLPNGDILIRRKPGAPPAPPIGNAFREFTQPGPDAPVVPEVPVVPGPKIDL